MNDKDFEDILNEAPKEIRNWGLLGLCKFIREDFASKYPGVYPFYGNRDVFSISPSLISPFWVKVRKDGEPMGRIGVHCSANHIEMIKPVN